MTKIILDHRFEDLAGMFNLILAWEEFLKGKKNKKDVQEFQYNLMDNILSIHQDLSNGTYRHGPYHRFSINDPKPRIIHKATVRDRLVHHAIYRILYPFFENTFIADSFSCRIYKGTHRALNRFKKFACVVSNNNTKTCWILKCDIKKFFASIHQDALMQMLDERIKDKRIVRLLQEVIFSFNSGIAGVGLPLGNLTSQLFCNIYMNEFDQFIKHKIKVKHYIRYADDFVIFSKDKQYLKSLLPLMKEFLHSNLMLTLHPDKIFLKTLASGMDFLGWVHFFDHRVLRRATKRKMLRKLGENPKITTTASYVGLLKHGNGYKLRTEILGGLTDATQLH